MAIIFGKKIYGRLECLQYANEKFNWSDDTIIGISAYYAFWGWLRARLTGKKIIYYCIDYYSPVVCTGWRDSIFIKLSWWLDKFLCKHCDDVWDISDRIAEGRAKYANYAKKGKLVPLSYPPTYFRNAPNKHPHPVFVGLVPYGKDIMPKDTVYISGNIELNNMLDLISKCSVGISIWKKKGNNYYGDPGKTKLYSACGIPVIMTDNTPYADIIKETEAGIVIDSYSKEAVSNAMTKIMSNYEYYKNNVKKTWEYINADRIFADKTILGK